MHGKKEIIYSDSVANDVLTSVSSYCNENLLAIQRNQTIIINDFTIAVIADG